MAGPHLEPLDPKLDVVFRALFANPHNTDMLISLLNDILDLTGDDLIETVELLPSQGQQRSLDDKDIMLDLLVRDGRGRRYAVEMQMRNHRAFPERIVYYTARGFIEQLRISEPYDVLRPLVQIVFTDFVLFPAVLDWRERFRLRGDSSDQVFSDLLSIVLVQLPLLRARPSAGLTPAEQWGVFLKEGTRMRTQTADQPWMRPILRKALDELERLGADPDTRALYNARLDAVRVMATELRGSYQEGLDEGLEQGRELGLEQGIEQGIEQGAAEATRALARRLLADGDSVERVARITGLPLETVQALPQQ